MLRQLSEPICQEFWKPLRFKARVHWGMESMLKARLLLLLLLCLLSFAGCNRKRNVEFTGDIRMVTPFTQPSVHTGKLYMSKGRLRVELSPMVIVYIADQQKGWEMFPDLKQYLDIGEKQVSTYFPPMTNGSPCPNSGMPSACKMVAKENIEGRSATKWEMINQHSEPVFLWTDDKLEIAVRWHIENVTYELTGIHQGEFSNEMFELPTGYTKLPAAWSKNFGVLQE
jgi:hypothetical protein